MLFFPFQHYSFKMWPFNNENAWTLMALPHQYSCPKVVIGCQDVCRDLMTSHVVTTWISVTYTSQNIEKSKIMFFKMTTLTFDLWPSNSSEIFSQATFTPNFRFSSVQPWERRQTDRQTHRFHTLDHITVHQKNLLQASVQYCCPFCIKFTHEHGEYERGMTRGAAPAKSAVACA